MQSSCDKRRSERNEMEKKWGAPSLTLSSASKSGFWFFFLSVCRTRPRPAGLPDQPPWTTTAYRTEWLSESRKKQSMHTHLAEVVEASLGDEREEHDERADRRDDPRRCELQRRRLAVGRHRRPCQPLPPAESVEIKGSRLPREPTVSPLPERNARAARRGAEAEMEGAALRARTGS